MSGERKELIQVQIKGDEYIGKVYDLISANWKELAPYGRSPGPRSLFKWLVDSAHKEIKSRGEN